MNKIIRDPLAWFVILGTLLFVLYEWAGRRADNVIVVDDKALIRWIGFQQKAFNEEAARAFLVSLSPEQRNDLVDRYVAEEASYREALAMGLDRNDAIIRKRLLQKMDFILLGTGQGPKISEADLKAYFEAHRENYRLPAQTTLSHAFFKKQAAIKDALARLNDGANHRMLGDRFPFHLNYVEADRQTITDHLGADVAAVVWDEKTPIGRWIGPVQSPLGFHLLLVRERRQEQDASLSDVAGRVLADLRDVRRRERQQKAQEALKERYRVEVR